MKLEFPSHRCNDHISLCILLIIMSYACYKSCLQCRRYKCNLYNWIWYVVIKGMCVDSITSYTECAGMNVCTSYTVYLVVQVILNVCT